MKNILVILFSFLFLQTVVAQEVDRTRPPKSGPAPVIKIGDPVIYHLANGITVLVVHNTKVPKVTATYTIDAGPILEGSKAGVNELMGGMLSEGTRLHSKLSFDEAVENLGASVNLSSRGGSVSALTRYFPRAFSLMAEALRQPAFTQASFDKLKSQAITAQKAGEKNPEQISQRAQGALLYGKTHPLGEFTTIASLEGLTLADVKDAYNNYITPSRGYLIFVGDITPVAARALAEKYLGTWKGKALKLPKLADVSNPDKTEIDLIDLPNAVQSIISVTNLIDLPYSNPDYFPLLVANQILGGGAESRLFKNIREKHGFTYGAYSSFSADRWQSSFAAGASVRNEKTDSAVAEFLFEINRLRTEAVNPEELQIAKAEFNGGFALGTESPARIAGFAKNIILNQLPKDYYRTFLQKINAVTADDVKRVAAKYFNYDNTRIIITGNAAQVKPGLERFHFAIHSFDKNIDPLTGNTVQKADIGATAVIDNYLKAIGGTDELKKIKSVQAEGNVNIQGTALSYLEKKKFPNLDYTEISMGGNALLKSVFDGKTGYQQQMGNKKDMTDKEIADKNSDEQDLVEQLSYQNKGFSLEVADKEKLNGADVYKLNITKPSGKKSTEYYDAQSGLLVRVINTMDVQGTSIQQVTDFSEYKKVDNILLPFRVANSVQTPQGNQDFTVEITSYKLNVEMADSDFK